MFLMFLFRRHNQPECEHSIDGAMTPPSTSNSTPLISKYQNSPSTGPCGVLKVHAPSRCKNHMWPWFLSFIQYIFKLMSIMEPSMQVFDSKVGRPSMAGLQEKGLANSRSMDAHEQCFSHFHLRSHR
jgi:hypothetical protein